jgi:hypothetical protein
MRKQPLPRFGAGYASDVSERAEVLVLRKASEVIEADSRQVRYFVFGEELLAGLDPNHRCASFLFNHRSQIIGCPNILQ